ncbi:hypothetical protein Rhopal_006482-T1 [Rhodotorula paludigena]|uniref:Uncharacterized protein n=1 Tax=Rhodotorula paludigena TaxID=86838 RepID=A0AAV5GWL6_9BASI|nr:hypothetical protein Rhopal_006482-T1 [Rhodotorula paludigena]
MSADWYRFRKALRSAIKARLKQLPGELSHAADDAHRDRLREAQRTLEHALAPTRSDSSKSYLRRTLDPAWWATVPEPRNEAARWAELVESAVKENGDDLVVVPARIERITAPGSTERQFLNNLWSALGLGIHELNKLPADLIGTQRLARQQNSVTPEHSLAKGSRNLVQLGYRQAALYSIPDRTQWVKSRLV